MDFYILVNNEQHGPFSVEQVKGYLAMGQYQPTDLAWHEGLPEWKPLGEFPQFATRQHRTPNYKSMPVRPAAARAKQSNVAKLIKPLIAVAVIGAAGGGGYYYYTRYWLPKHQASVAAQAAPTNAVPATPAEPKTLEELNRWYEEPPAGQNAATAFQQGFDTMQVTDSDKNSYSLPLLGKAPTPSVAAPLSTTVSNTVQGFVERNKVALDAFQRGAVLSGSRYPIDLTQGSATLLPHLVKVRNAARLAELYSLEQAAARQPTQAVQGVLLALASARTLEPEPLTISQLTRAACIASALEGLEQTVNRVALPADSLTQLQRAINRAADYDSAGTGFNRALVAERIHAVTNLSLPPEKLRALLTPSSPAGAARAPAQAKLPEKAFANLEQQRQFIEDSFNQVLQARQQNFPARLQADTSLGQRVEDGKSKGYVFVQMLLPALGKLTSREAGALAQLRLAQTAVALEIFRATAHHYPDALSELAPKPLAAVPQDPFDGQQLRYRKAGEGYVIYSVGPDLRDDGGARKAGSDDIIFGVVRAPKSS